jgi:hypothetical protein
MLLATACWETRVAFIPQISEVSSTLTLWVEKCPEFAMT